MSERRDIGTAIASAFSGGQGGARERRSGHTFAIVMLVVFFVVMMGCLTAGVSIYRSVAGNAEIEFMEGDDAFEAAKLCMARYPETEKAPYNLASVPHTCFARLKVVELNGKANPGKPDILE